MLNIYDIMLAHIPCVYSDKKMTVCLKQLLQVATQGAESAVYDCLVGNALMRKLQSNQIVTARRQIDVSLARLADLSWKRSPGRPVSRCLDQIRSDDNLHSPADLWRCAVRRGQWCN